MKPTHSLSRVMLSVLGAVGLMVMGTASAEAQQQRRTDRILILTPLPAVPEDSAFVHEYAQALRDRAQSKFRHKWTVVTTEQLNELLIESGFDPTTIIGPEMADQVARHFQAAGYISGTVERNSARPIAKLRLVDSRRSGLAGMMTVMGQPGDPARALADRTLDSLNNQVRAADHAKECNTRRDRADFGRARRAAEKAFELYPNHPSAANCLTYVFEALKEPVDSSIWALEKATIGDPQNIRAWEDLARLYQRSGNTRKAVEAFEHQLGANPNDMDIRFAVAAGYITLEDYARGVEILRVGLEQEPENLRTVRLMAQACYDGQLWGCALEASTRLFDLDTALVSDTTFYPRMVALATSEGDSTAMRRWATLGVQYLSNSLPLWRTKATLEFAAKDSAAALESYERVVQLAANDVVSVFRLMTLKAAKLVIDTVTPLDREALSEVGNLLTRLITLSQDTAFATQAAVSYLRIGSQLIQTGVDPDLGLQWVDSTLAYDWQKLLQAQANFWIGFALYNVASGMDAKVRQSESCVDVAQYSRTVERGRAAMIVGRDVSPETAQQLIGAYDQMRELAGQFRQFFKCSG